MHVRRVKTCGIDWIGDNLQKAKTAVPQFQKEIIELQRIEANPLGGGVKEVWTQAIDPVFDYKGIRIIGAQFGELNRLPQDPRIDPPPSTCFRCWEGNYSPKRCPKKGNIPDNFCCNCGLQDRSNGHL